MTPATNNRNAQAFWEAAYLKRIDATSIPTGPLFQRLPYMIACAALDNWLRAFGTQEERVQFEEWRQAQDAGNEGEAG